MSIYCQQCHTATAVVHVTEKKGGEKIERHLCEECAESQDGIPPKAGTSVSMLQIFQQFVENSSGTKKSRERNCECGMTFSEFKAKGRFGCAEDYDLFFERLLPLLQRIHGATKHVPETGESAGPSSTPSPAAPRPQQQELSRLRRDLKKAVDDEAYEDAARIRDRIQELEFEERERESESES